MFTTRSNVIASIPAKYMEIRFYIVIHCIRPVKLDGLTMYDNQLAFHGGVIPPYLLVANSKPDLFLVNESTRKAMLLE